MRETAMMMLEQYLKKRIKDILKRPPSQITGCIAIMADEGWEDNLQLNLDKAIQSLQTKFMRSDKPGHAYLTSCAARIGRSVLGYDNEHELNTFLIVGGLFIEALYNNAFINIYRIPMGFTRKYSEEKKPDTPYMLSITPFWEKLAPVDFSLERIHLQSTTQEKPWDTTRNFRIIGNYKGPVVKDTGRDFHIGCDEDWVKALDKMQQTPWRINRRVLKALEESEEVFFESTPPKDPEEKVRYDSKKLAYKYTVVKANKVKDWDNFYQGMDCDYRSRYYTIESFLSYQGQDFARGIMNFAQGKPMTEEGLQWLAIHTASSYNMTYGIDEIPEWCEYDYKEHLKGLDLTSISVDKMALVDKIEWTNQYMDEIIDAGRYCEFLLNDKGKAAAEKPVSFLSCCVEWFDYWEATDRGEIHISHLPVPLDGTSNGERLPF